MNESSYRSIRQALPTSPHSPIRAELFGVERLEQLAQTLANEQEIEPATTRGRPVTKRLYDNTRVLTATYLDVVRAHSAQEPFTPAAEWLLDNFHIVDEQIREIKSDLPPGFYRRLPKLADGPLQGYPRVFGIAWAVVAHTDSAFDEERLRRFVEAYQRVKPLTIGELWALSITLRITLVENLRRLAEAITAQQTAIHLANRLADQFSRDDQGSAEPGSKALRELDQAPWSPAFAVELAQRLRDHDPHTTPALHWLNNRLVAERITTDDIVRQEFQTQSAIDVTVRNVIMSMRLVSMINWAEFFETVSPVDAVLRGASDFAAMDFPTRDLYRHAIEELARQSGRDEVDVAQRAIAASKRAQAQNSDKQAAEQREADPGYYLISRGRPAFEKELGCRVPFGKWLLRLNSNLGVMSYVGMIAIVTAVVLALILWAVSSLGIDGWQLLVMAFVGVVPTTDIAVALVNRAITQQVGGKLLPGLELRKGITPELSTIVVVPILLTGIAMIEEQIERLEAHYLSNPDDNFSFALISDWRDCAVEHEDDDGPFLDAVSAGIARLNARYASPQRSNGGTVAAGERFFLLHRRRIWNESEGMWLGWERKRGKLHELNRLLRGATDTGFIAINGRAAALPPGIRYVISLDADTRVPIGAARRLVGKIAHPLNQPVFDPKAGLVVRGHGMLQPRVTPSLPLGSEGSLFQRAFSGPNGLDPYAAAVSDVYQDLFEEGSYCGKGIYEIDVFEAALEEQIPENSMLSHDLLEGIFARSGLASDIEVVEEFPSRYAVSAARQHRWVRGDWQLLPWIFGFSHNSKSGKRITSIPLMGRWKLLDNLRRSLSAPAALLALLVGWWLPLPVAAAWTAYILLTVALPSLLPAIASVIPHRAGVSLRNHLLTLRGDFALGLMQSGFLIIFLAHQAWIMVDAVARTLFRLFVSRAHLLEWATAAQTAEDFQFDRRLLTKQMAASVASAGAVIAMLSVSGQQSWMIAAPFIALWVASPLVAFRASMPPPSSGHLSIKLADSLALRLVARRTWRFFEAFVTAADNMLPPDNFQETPRPVIAHRTSPTNIGLYLLSVAAAHDFGWLGTLEALERLEVTFASMGKLERYRGHFYNWYDTSDLRTLEPKYVSSVDSGNLAGHLLALGNACREICAGPIGNKNWISGLEDIIALIRDAASQLRQDRPTPSVAFTKFNQAIETFDATLQNPPSTPLSLVQRLSEMSQRAEDLLSTARLWSIECRGSAETDIIIWAEVLRSSVLTYRRDLDELIPWVALITPDMLADVEAAAVLGTTPTLAGLPNHCEALRSILARGQHEGLAPLMTALEQSADAAQALLRRIATIADLTKTMFDNMEFGFMYDSDRQLMSIGFRESDGGLDGNFYDLLASEARLASFIAIAKGDIPAKHWFQLGRTLTPIDGSSGLISWSGSMFEYLMPSLVMRAPSGSLLEETNRLVVWRQEQYGKQLGVPWGMSESEYDVRDIEHTYQYSGFGVPDLGYKRGLGESIVIAPYATGLASMVDPSAAAINFARMAKIGARGVYGWYEALDFTRSRLPQGSNVAVVRAYMAHHQAMTVIGIANALQDGRMRDRFHAEPIVRAAELLLQERMPRDVAVARPLTEMASTAAQDSGQASDPQRYFNTAHSRVPRTHLLSNGNLSTMITAAGSGYTRWHDIAITRWREDVTCDGRGSYIFVRNVHDGRPWSAGYHPCAVEPDSYDVAFSEDRVEIARSDETVTMKLEVMISPEDDAEVRRISITNHGNTLRDVEVTSYAELALARQADDLAHPAFASLFVETEFLVDLGAILATRRQRSAADPLVWVAHLTVVEGESSADVQFETDRARFLGRGQTIRAPAALADGWPLSNTVGPVLDPILSLRRIVRIPRGGTVCIAFWTMAAATREAVLGLADKHHDKMAFDRAKTLAWTQAQMQFHHLGIDSNEAHLFQRLANHILYPDPTLRPSEEILTRGAGKASILWVNGISGDLPIVLVQIEEDGHLGLVRQLLRAHQYWRSKQLAVDLVILNERAASYIQDFENSLEALVRMNQPMPRVEGRDPRGTVFVLRNDLVSPEVRNLLNSCARAVLYGFRGSLAEQVKRARDPMPITAPPARRSPNAVGSEAPLPRPATEFSNGLGGFINDGREYLTVLENTECTPAPWLNVISNPSFGFQVSTDGSGFTWSVNSQQNQITPWSNDPVCDSAGEAIYVRDDDTGDVWGPTALPIREKTSSYAVRHGQGYSQFDHDSHGIALKLLQYVPVDDSIKISRLTITNHSGRVRRLSITAYVEWVLGANRSTSAPFVLTDIDGETGAIFARNPWSDAFGERVAFADLNGKQTAWTCDRTEFLGRNGAMDRPLGLNWGTSLSNRAGAGLDPCGALQTRVTLGANDTTEIVFFLGQSASAADAQSLILKYRQADLDAVFASVNQQWDDILGVVQVKTPDRALDILLNRWLPYQTLACRVWARSAFYQASGAYGFRDQLQDVMAVCLSRPDIARAHLLRAAGRQFVEGDVQHWWLPIRGNGIRTRVSDDRGWLAFVVAHYVEVTGDLAVLNEVVPFIDGPVLKPGESDAFFLPTQSTQTATLFEHCALALDKSLETGAHGLPLMGTCDWNDGMSRVGDGGQGESIWLGWFLCSALDDFAGVADLYGKTERAAQWRQQVVTFKEALETEGWDGDWYRRAYFDDGSPLGSVANTQCRIDSIAQSWSVISGAGAPTQTERAMAALDKYLVRRDAKLLLLFTPPFDHPTHDPGYIAGYPKGVRENGGQYTHGAIWAVMAYAMQGKGDMAGELLAMLNPIRHADSPTSVQRYKVEPYVICADVYSEPPHVGRGGWTWYTGSAAWFYRVALERVLGFRVQGENLLLDPCIPHDWPRFEIEFRHGSARYQITVENPHGVCRGVLSITLDQAALPAAPSSLIPLVDDGIVHQVHVVLGAEGS